MQLNEISQQIYYHASFSPIKRFWSLTHFGTYKAALSRMQIHMDEIYDSGTPYQTRDIYLYPVRLNITNPLRTVDVYNERPYIVGDVCAYILKKFKSQLDLDQINRLHQLQSQKTTPASSAELQSILQQMGYDGLSYRNKVEDPGHISLINLSSNQVQRLGDPIVISSDEIYQKPKRELAEQTARPAELGDAYFWIDNHLVDIRPERNHRDWLVTHQEALGLPDYIQQKQVRALWEAYKAGIIRIVWDMGARWRVGAGHGQGNVLYLNGFERDVWNNMRNILNQKEWSGQINTVVIEYVKDVGGKPNWYHTDIFKGGDIEALYRGKRPRRERLPPDAVYGGEPGLAMIRETNHQMNLINDSAQSVFEMFNNHMMSVGFFDKFKHVPHNGYMTHPGHNYNVYLGLH